MIFRRIGGTDLECSIIGLGTGRLASASGGISRSEAGRLLDGAAECGINWIDTADSYGQGECEKIIGAALCGQRDRFLITTKTGYCFSPLGAGLRWLKPLAKRVLKHFRNTRKLTGNVRAQVSRQDFSPLTIRRSVVASLERLQTDHVDFFLLHSPTLQAMNDSGIFETLQALKQEGKIRHFGVSSPEAAVLERAFQIRGMGAVQTPVNPLSDNAALLAKLEASKIGVIANQIFLSGQLLAPSSSGSEDNQVRRVKDHLSSVAASRDVSMNYLLIEHALSQPGVVSVLTGTNCLDHLRQNVADALAVHAASVQTKMSKPNASGCIT
jgi:aryl-alcohol dehydrogenase-like predicted oxidoreductase